MKNILPLSVAFALTSLIHASAAGITYIGEDITTQGAYNNTSVAKTFAPVTNVYGADGYAFFGVQNPGTNNPGGFGNQGGTDPFNFVNNGNSGDFTSFVKTPTYLSSFGNVSMDSVYGGYGYSQIDVPGQPSSSSPSTTQMGLGGVHGGSDSENLLTFTFGQNEADIQFGVAFTEGNPDFELIQTGGNITDGSATTYLLQDSGLDYAFFDLTDVQAGDTFVLQEESTATNKVIAGVVFDTPVEAPEPKTFALIFAGVGMLVLARRRTAKI